MRLALIIHAMCCGGAERVMSILARYWVGQGHDVFLLTFDSGTEPPFYPVPETVRHIPLGLVAESHDARQALANNLTRLSVLRRTLARIVPDVVVSFLPATNVLAILAGSSLDIPVVVSERTDPFLYRIGKVWDTLRLATYLLADRVVVQTEAAIPYFPPAVRRRIEVIPNPVPEPVPGPPPTPPFPGRPVVVGLGRLHHEKGFDLLIRAMARIRHAHLDWHLAIFGEGPARNELEALVKDLDLADRVWMPGAVRDPARYLARADIFVLPSRTEGFPNALCEAMAVGLPVIAADCRSGPSEIVRHGTDGLLVPVEDVAALTRALDTLMTDASLRTRLAARAPEILNRYGLEQVMARWETLLRNSVAGIRRATKGRHSERPGGRSA